MYARILVPVDGSATSNSGLEEAIKLAAQSGARIKLVHVVNEFVDSGLGPSLYYETVVLDLRAAGNRTLTHASAYTRGRGVLVESEMIETSSVRPAGIILEAAMQWHADLIAMGTHGRRGLTRSGLGSDAQLVLRSASIPVLMVRPRPRLYLDHPFCAPSSHTRDPLTGEVNFLSSQPSNVGEETASGIDLGVVNATQVRGLDVDRSASISMDAC